jgi:RimJ/RimL family protein N-acetyltransferase
MPPSLPKLPKCGQRVILRRLENEDLDALYTIESDPEVKRYMREPVQLPRAEWVDKMALTLHGCVTLAVLARDNLRFVGRASVSYFASEEEREIQVVLAKPDQGRHFGREVCEILIRAAFDELSAERIVGVVHPENQRSLKLLQNFGFQQSGVISDQSWQRGHLKFTLSRAGYVNWMKGTA